MNYKVYYYKKADGSWVFHKCIYYPMTIVLNERDGARYHTRERLRGNDPWRLYLDIPEDFALIKKLFFNPSYWENRTWQEEDQA